MFRGFNQIYRALVFWWTSYSVLVVSSDADETAWFILRGIQNSFKQKTVLVISISKKMQILDIFIILAMN